MSFKVNLVRFLIRKIGNLGQYTLTDKAISIKFPLSFHFYVCIIPFAFYKNML